MIEITFLADHPEVIPTLTNWFRAQWPDYYAGRTTQDVAQDFSCEAKRTGLPVRLVAFCDGDLVGTITLREQAIRDLPAYHPGLGGLFVLEQYRGQGIGTMLVKAGMDLVRSQGYHRVYATTNLARGILERLGWQAIQDISHNNEQLVLYLCDLEIN